MKSMLLLSLALALAIGAAPAAGEDEGAEKTPTVKEIVEKTNHVAYYQGKSGRAKVSMRIVDSQMRERTRDFTILRKDVKDTAEKDIDTDQSFYVYFRSPPDLDRMVFMVLKHPGQDDDRWLYLPDLDLVKRISAADKRTSFAGSHFLYEDVSGRHIDADEHELVETTKDYYVLKNTPKDPKSVEFAYFKMWIHRKTFIVVKTSYHDGEDRETRRYSALKVQTIDGHPTVTASRMADLVDKSYTDMTYSDVKYDLDLPDDLFTQRYLRKPPTEQLD